ncbi:hypothetical protein [Mycoplasma hafezii]|uniref:hypothetical protein n=1 Tax=Mycoplasma hafezii TaxID=525886 RepID=UPI003CED9D69
MLKKYKKTFLTLFASVSALTLVPVVSVSCLQPNKVKYKKEEENLKQLITNLEQENTKVNGEYKYIIISLKNYELNLLNIDAQIHAVNNGDISDLQYLKLASGIQSVMMVANELKTKITANYQDRLDKKTEFVYFNSVEALNGYLLCYSLSGPNLLYVNMYDSLQSYSKDVALYKGNKALNTEQKQLIQAVEEFLNTYWDICKSILMTFYQTNNFELDILSDSQYTEITDFIEKQQELFNQLISNTKITEEQIASIKNLGFEKLFNEKGLLKK